MSDKSKAAAAKAQGNDAFKRRDYPAAIEAYSEAIKFDPTDHVFFSNRAAAYLGLRKWGEAATDGLECIRLKPDFLKGYFRAASGLKECAQYVRALKVARDGLRKFGDNPDLRALVEELIPMAEREEKSKRSGMTREEGLKEEGNDMFKAARFEDAIPKYSQAYEACADKTSEIAIKILNNRAACFKQIGNHEGVVRDCSTVLEHEPRNEKALLRRALAFEALEKYRLALQDIREALAINPGNKLANEAQHRIGRAVRTLKASGRSI
jgi:stress-induced-phosphoprotein 1